MIDRAVKNTSGFINVSKGAHTFVVICSFIHNMELIILHNF